jgi:hypothetical protein
VSSDDVFKDIIKKMPVAFAPVPFGRSIDIYQTVEGDPEVRKNWVILTLTQNNTAMSVWMDEYDILEIMQDLSESGQHLSKLNVQTGSGLMIASPDQAQRIIAQQNSLTGTHPSSRHPKSG